MLRKIGLKLGSSCRHFFSGCKPVYGNWSYYLMSGSIAMAIILTNAAPLQSLTPLIAQSNLEPKQELVDVEQFSKLVEKIELKWEKDYERYFNRDFSRKSRSATQIAQHLRDISQQTGINPAVVWAIPKPQFLELILVTPDKQLVKKEIRGADRTTLEIIVKQLETAIADRQSRKYLPPAKQIYRWLFTPLEPYLEAENIDTLLLCTGPMLRSLPFAALHDGEKFAIEKYNLARIPAFNLTDTSYEVEEERQVLAMGASEFADLPSLPGVAVELSTIVPTLWSGQKLLNEDFTVANLKAAHQQGNFDIVHLATHSEFRPGSPDNSYIQFSDRQLKLDRINSLELDDPLLDLLVLSACETALGDEDAEFGFAGLAMQAGVKSVLASLWPIDDAATVGLMSEFYQRLKSTTIKSAALREAQVAMLQGKISVSQGELRNSQLAIPLPPELNNIELPSLNHPFYWAGFTIIGNPW